MGNCPVCGRVSARAPVYPYCSNACKKSQSLRTLAKLIEARVQHWPDWKHRAARRGLFTEETQT